LRRVRTGIGGGRQRIGIQHRRAGAGAAALHARQARIQVDVLVAIALFQFLDLESLLLDQPAQGLHFGLQLGDAVQQLDRRLAALLLLLEAGDAIGQAQASALGVDAGGKRE
jgi:hypothetical protein